MEFDTNQSMLSDFDRFVHTERNTSINGNSCQLCIYTPVAMPHQVLRSHVYDFSDEFKDAISDPKHTSTVYATRPGAGRAIPGINEVIKPDPNGIIPNLDNWGNMYTFTMIIDVHQEPIGYGLYHIPHKKFIASGYFLQEPMAIDPYGNVIKNLDAIMVFTHVSDISVTRRAAYNGIPSNGVDIIPRTYDYVGCSTPMHYTQNVYLNVPGDISQVISEQINHGDLSNNYTPIGEFDLNNRRFDEDTRQVSNDLKSPRWELNQLLDPIDKSIAMVNETGDMYDRHTPTDQSLDRPMRVMEHLSDYAETSRGLPFKFKAGDFTLNFGQPISLRDLDNYFGDKLTVIPCKIMSPESQWDIHPQVGMSMHGQLCPITGPRQIYSSLASTVISSVCADTGISDIKFSYRWVDSFDGIIRGKNEEFKLNSEPGFMIMFDAVEKKKRMDLFKARLDWQLFEIIHDTCGPFEIHVTCDSAGPIMINLVLYEFPQENDNTYFYSDNKLGGIINPAICNLDTMSNNFNQYVNLARECGFNKTFNYQPQGVITNESDYGW